MPQDIVARASLLPKRDGISIEKLLAPYYDDIENLYALGHRAADIAALYGCYYATITSILRKRDVHIRKKGDLTPEQEAKVIEVFLESDRNATQTHKKLNLDTNRIMSLVRKHGLEHSYRIIDYKQIETTILTEFTNDYIDNQMTIKQIIEKYDLSHRVIRRILKKFDIPLRETTDHRLHPEIRPTFVPLKTLCGWRTNAKTRDLSWELRFQDLQEIWDTQKGRCYYSNIELQCDKDIKKHRAFTESPYLLSIERLNPDIGYIKGNVVFCCHFINLMKSDWSLPDFNKMLNRLVDGVIRKRKEAHHGSV
jgi:hypothetical protein